MANGLILKNDIDTEFNVTHPIGRTAKSMSSTDIAQAVDTINDFPATPTDGDVCIVRGTVGGIYEYVTDTWVARTTWGA